MNQIINIKVVILNVKLERELQAAKTNPKQSKLNFSSKISESFIKDDHYNEDKI